jgi:hypothetical protein
MPLDEPPGNAEYFSRSGDRSFQLLNFAEIADVTENISCFWDYKHYESTWEDQRRTKSYL